MKTMSSSFPTFKHGAPGRFISSYSSYSCGGDETSFSRGEGAGLKACEVLRVLRGRGTPFQSVWRIMVDSSLTDSGFWVLFILFSGWVGYFFGCCCCYLFFVGFDKNKK